MGLWGDAQAAARDHADDDTHSLGFRQIGTAFPPPVAAAVARKIDVALSVKRIYKVA